MSARPLALPERLPFVCTLTVQARDINYGGHLGHDAAVSLLHEARRRWLAAAGFDEADSAGAGLIMLELEVHYAAEAFWGDRLRAELALVPLGAARCEFRYRVGRDGHEVLRARTLMGCPSSGLVCSGSPAYSGAADARTVCPPARRHWWARP